MRDFLRDSCPSFLAGLNFLTMYREALMTLGEVAKLLHFSKSKLYHERKAGRLRTVQFGRSVRVRPRDIQKYINAARSAEQAP
jgi:excisionase family DNA binding protein